MHNRPDSSERRKTPRLKREITVQYRVKQAPLVKGAPMPHQQAADISRTRDISTQGLFFTSSQLLPAQAILEIKLRVSAEKGYIELEGEVVDCQEISQNLLYKVRVKFVNLNEEQKEALQGFIQSFKKG